MSTLHSSRPKYKRKKGGEQEIVGISDNKGQNIKDENRGVQGKRRVG